VDGHDLAYLFTTSGKKEQIHLPFKAQDAAQKKGPIECGGFCHICRRAKRLGCRHHHRYPTSTPTRYGTHGVPPPPPADTRPLPPVLPSPSVPCMGHYYRFKRGDRVIITTGSYQGSTGTVDSAVFQRTVDPRMSTTPATMSCWTTSRW